MKDVNIKQVKGVEGQLYSFDLTIDNSYNTLYNNIVFKRERSKWNKRMISLIILVVLIFVNAFFASAEIAFISLNDAKIDRQAKEGNRKAKK